MIDHPLLTHRQAKKRPIALVRPRNQSQEQRYMSSVTGTGATAPLPDKLQKKPIKLSNLLREYLTFPRNACLLEGDIFDFSGSWIEHV